MSPLDETKLFARTIYVVRTNKTCALFTTWTHAKKTVKKKKSKLVPKTF